jgi:hypothetical protein
VLFSALYDVRKGVAMIDATTRVDSATSTKLFTVYPQRRFNMESELLSWQEPS